jgi:hypothetical protein
MVARVQGHRPSASRLSRAPWRELSDCAADVGQGHGIMRERRATRGMTGRSPTPGTRRQGFPPTDGESEVLLRRGRPRYLVGLLRVFTLVLWGRRVRLRVMSGMFSRVAT